MYLVSLQTSKLTIFDSILIVVIQIWPFLTRFWQFFPISKVNFDNLDSNLTIFESILIVVIQIWPFLTRFWQFFPISKVNFDNVGISFGFFECWEGPKRRPNVSCELNYDRIGDFWNGVGDEMKWMAAWNKRGTLRCYRAELCCPLKRFRIMSALATVQLKEFSSSPPSSNRWLDFVKGLRIAALPWLRRVYFSYWIFLRKENWS